MKVSDCQIPLVAILRGLKPEEAPAIGAALFDAGFELLEVPLNRPGALESISAIAAMAPQGTLVGGGTMLTTGHVHAVHAAGGRLLVAPNCNSAVIRCGVELGMLCAPGVATPTEAFHAIEAGAHALKIFPAESLGHRGLRTLKSVLPGELAIWPVGGITPGSMADWVQAGATGFGIGSALYQPGTPAHEVRARARDYLDAWRATQAG